MGVFGLDIIVGAFLAASVSIGESPLFSAKASGTESNADAKARMAYCSIEGISSAAFCTANDELMSAAPPP